VCAGDVQPLEAPPYKSYNPRHDKWGKLRVTVTIKSGDTNALYAQECEEAIQGYLTVTESGTQHQFVKHFGREVA
jgi:hypothetical protein